MIFLKERRKIEKKLEFSGFYDKFPENPYRKIKKKRTVMGNLRKKRRRKIAQHKRKKMLKAMRHKNK